jgi:hypothetical protein
MKASTLTDDRKEDRKYLTLILGGSLIISLATLLTGSLLSMSKNEMVAGVGEATVIQGFMWVAGTAMMTVMVKMKMRNLYNEGNITDSQE